ncbi:hypothetical protein [Rothia aerolata]|uniref:Uncharacterized protein n=1 Tax=Rothia aerolata TaxID=1812262 RepID=A0A917MQU2_9MICC|nr:hypothetical protein [Rothia aerolata]GGH58847.1 hypothetical protein GCM10007359_05450 [Rothia aerolata]
MAQARNIGSVLALATVLGTGVCSPAWAQAPVVEISPAPTELSTEAPATTPTEPATEENSVQKPAEATPAPSSEPTPLPTSDPAPEPDPAPSTGETALAEEPSPEEPTRTTFLRYLTPTAPEPATETGDQPETETGAEPGPETSEEPVESAAASATGTRSPEPSPDPTTASAAPSEVESSEPAPSEPSTPSPSPSDAAAPQDTPPQPEPNRAPAEAARPEANNQRPAAPQNIAAEAQPNGQDSNPVPAPQRPQQLPAPNPPAQAPAEPNAVQRTRGENAPRQIADQNSSTGRQSNFALGNFTGPLAPRTGVSFRDGIDFARNEFIDRRNLAPSYAVESGFRTEANSWISDFLNQEQQSADGAVDSSGVTGADAQGNGTSAAAGNSLRQLGQSIVTGKIPLIFFTLGGLGAILYLIRQFVRDSTKNG